MEEQLADYLFSNLYFYLEDFIRKFVKTSEEKEIMLRETINFPRMLYKLNPKTNKFDFVIWHTYYKEYFNFIIEKGYIDK